MISMPKTFIGLVDNCELDGDMWAMGKNYIYINVI